jgi:hypothetical protein
MGLVGHVVDLAPESPCSLPGTIVRIMAVWLTILKPWMMMRIA